MAQDEAKKRRGKKSLADKSFTNVVKIMVNTPPISNEEIVKRKR